MQGKRRLPLVSSGDGFEDDGAPRPGWQWVAFGSLAILVTWIPLAAIGLLLAARWSDDAARGSLRAAAAAGAASLAALSLAALAGGFLVGRLRASKTALREAALSGLAVSIFAVGASWLALGANGGAILVVVFGTAFAAAGGGLGRLRFGRERR